VDDRIAAAIGQVDVEEDDVGIELLDQRHGLLDACRLTDHVDGVAELGAHARAEEVVIVDEDDAALHDPLRGTDSSTSVPSPGVLETLASPPTRSIRRTIESAIPRRSAGTAAGSNPAPRSLTKPATPASVGPA